MAIQKTEAIVIKTQPFRSTSLIITFYTKSHGKIKGIAKGVREQRQMRASLYELFTRLEIIFYEKSRSDLHLISDGFMLESYQPLRSKFYSISFASYFVDLLDRLTEVHDANEALYDLLDFAFRYLPSLPGSRIARIFEIKLLDEIGWLPYLEGCLDCHDTSLEEGFFSARQGALFCANCQIKHPETTPMSREVLSTLRYYTHHDLEESIRYGLTLSAERSLQRFMEAFLMDRLGKPLKSRQFLEKVKASLSATS